MQLFNGLEYLMIDIAGSFGLDKKTWQERTGGPDAGQKCAARRNLILYDG